MGNKNSSNSKVHGKPTKVTSIAQHVPKQSIMSFQREHGHRIKGTTILRDDEYMGKYNVETPLDNDETFNNFIRRTKYKIRTVTMSKSNIDREQSNNTAPAAPDHEASNGNNSYYKENYQNDQFDDFIQITKKKMRATSSIRNNSFTKKP